MRGEGGGSGLVVGLDVRCARYCDAMLGVWAVV